MLRRLTALLLLLLPALVSIAAPPDETTDKIKLYDARIRYRIGAFGQQRIQQYREMIAFLKANKWVRSEADQPSENEATDTNATRLQGTLPPSTIDRVLTQRHLRSLTLSPSGVKMPAKGEKVRIDVTLEGGFLREVQRDLARQTAGEFSKRLGFVEAVGYDHKGFTRLVGSLPVENAEKVGDLVRIDIRLPDAARGETQAQVAERIRARLEKAGTFAEAAKYDNRNHTRLIGHLLADKLQAVTTTFRDLTDDSEVASINSAPLVRLVVIRPDLPVPSARPESPKLSTEQLKFDPALRSLLGDEEAAGKSSRLEVILGNHPSCRDKGWIRVVESAGVIAEGRTGPIVTVLGEPKVVAPKLAALPEVVAVRLPRAARQAMENARGDVPAKWEPVKASGLVKLHSVGMRGKGTRIALIADDFTGWETLKGRKDQVKLPDPVMIDLTAARNPSLVPDPYPQAGKGAVRGHGTRCAAAIQAAAPEAELTLVRIDAAASYMLEEVARAIHGETERTVNLAARFRELELARETFSRRADELLAERKLAYSDFREDDAPKKRRAEYEKKRDAFEAEQAEFRKRDSRYLQLVTSLKGLRGVRLVASALVWLDGYPVDGTSALTRYFDDKPFRSALWFQSAGDSRGQSWSGFFRDIDGTSVMDFTEEDAKLPAGMWTKKINFLTWQPVDAEKPIVEIPAQTRIRITVQWREPHDCLPLRAGEDVYREPLAKLKLVVVRQLDSMGKMQPGDDLEVVGESSILPQRLDQTLTAATWEHAVEVRVAQPGRYGVFIEGKPPESTQADGEARLPGQKRFGELRTRLFVNTLEGPGRAMWSTFRTEMAALGMPADSRAVITVGAADAKGKSRDASALGPPFNLALMQKPDVLAYDEGGGSAEATCFAAGLTASAWGSTGTLLGAVERLRPRPGQLMRVR